MPIGTNPPFDHHSSDHAADPVAEAARRHDSFSGMLELPGGDGFGGAITLPHNHLAFGLGIHRCIGAPPARQEFIVVMELGARLCRPARLNLTAW